MADKQTLFNDSLFFVIGNIPGHFRSHNLRTFFSNFIEQRGFTCFHFKHRPEHIKQQPHHDKHSLEKQACIDQREGSVASSGDVSESRVLTSEAAINCQQRQPMEAAAVLARTKKEPDELTKASTCCCIVAVDKTMVDQLIKLYDGKTWHCCSIEDRSLRTKRVKIVSIAAPWRQEGMITFRYKQSLPKNYTLYCSVYSQYYNMLNNH